MSVITGNHRFLGVDVVINSLTNMKPRLVVDVIDNQLTKEVEDFVKGYLSDWKFIETFCNQNTGTFIMIFEEPEKLKTWEYSLTTSVIWTSFDFGEVQAANMEDALVKAREKLSYNLKKVNEALLHSDNTASEEISIGMNFDEIEVKLKEEKEVYYQPIFENPRTGKAEHPIDKDGLEIHSFEVYSSKEEAQKDFPYHEILTYSGNDIEDLTYRDIYL